MKPRGSSTVCRLLHLRRYGIKVLILDHEGKAKTHRGASRKEDSITYAIKLNELPKPHGFVGARFLSLFEKNRNHPAANLPIEWTFAYKDSKMTVDWREKEAEKPDADDGYLPPLRVKPLLYNEWWKALGEPPKGTFDRAKDWLIARSRVRHDGKRYHYLKTLEEMAQEARNANF
jgi:hypothetical protein